MRENVYQHFKFSRRATRLVAFYGIIFPATIYGLSALYDVSRMSRCAGDEDVLDTWSWSVTSSQASSYRLPSEGWPRGDR